MAMKRKREARVERRYARSATKKGWVLRKPAHLGRILAILVAVLLVAALALVWGSYLKAEADARAAAAERGEWTLDPGVTTPIPVEVPDIRAVSIKPQGNVGDILIAGQHGGVILPLGSVEQPLAYLSSVGTAAGLSIAADAVSLPEDVARVQKRDLNVTGTFTVTCFDESDPSLRTYRRGLELALLREYAEAGMNDILLLGLPAGDDIADGLATAFLADLKALLAELESPPALGVALLPACFTVEGETETEAGSPYAGSLTPARMLNVCDYVAMDLRDCDASEVASILPRIPYAYVRYSLRLLLDRNTPAAVEDTLSHGFTRIFEMEPSPKK